MNNSIINDDTISEMQDSINKNLKSIEKEIMKQKINIGIAESSINDIGSILKLTNSKELKKICINKEEKDKIVSELITDIKDIENYISKTNEEMYIVDIQEMKKRGIDINKNLKDKTEINFFIKQNGLGYNNILSMATEMSNSKQIDFKFLLILSCISEIVSSFIMELFISFSIFTKLSFFSLVLANFNNSCDN